MVDLLLRKRIEASKMAIIKPSSVRQRTAESPVTVGVPKKHILTYTAGLQWSLPFSCLEVLSVAEANAIVISGSSSVL